MGLRVFLSSTEIDLQGHRAVADDTLLRLQQTSVIMERFGPLPDTPVTECERMAASADVVVCIVAHRYGYVPEKGRGSITRREVEAARRAGKSVYAWIVDDGHPWTEAKEQDRLTMPEVLADPDKVQEVGAAVKALHEFKTWLRQELAVETFTTPEDLGRKIATALANVAQTTKTAGHETPSASPRPELRIVHALQPAPHFAGREALVQRLSAWVDDTASPDRIHALVAAGGTGKTAIAEHVVTLLQRRWPPPGAGNVLVWSFYERPEADAFVRECGQLFLGEPDDAPPSGRLERLQRGLRDGRPHLIVLDGLERVQAEAGAGRVRGELEEHTLKLLLQAIAAGLGRTRALVTSRFPLTDLRNWLRRGFVETQLDDLPAEAARQVLRSWGISGSDGQVDAVCEQVGRHALSVAVLGSYLSHFEGGRIEAAATMKLDAIAGDDPKAAKLARVLASYADRLPPEERDLLTRLSVFPRGITIALLGTLVDAGGQVAGLLINAKPELARLLQRLVDRGLVFRYAATDGTLNWTAHPFVRERFAALLGCPAQAVFGAVSRAIGQGLEKQPVKPPESATMLDRYEQLIEATRLAGQTRDAFGLYLNALGGYRHICQVRGDFVRGYRILRGFLPASGDPNGFGAGLSDEWQGLGLNALALVAQQLGRLHEAAPMRSHCETIARRTRVPRHECIALQNSSELLLELGRIHASLAAAHESVEQSPNEEAEYLMRTSLGQRAHAHHQLGNISFARRDFVTARIPDGKDARAHGATYYYACHQLDLGHTAVCLAVTESALQFAQSNNWNSAIVLWHSLLARLALMQRRDPGRRIAEIRAWTARTGDMALTIEGYCLAARAALARGDLIGADSEADDGIRQARLCGYRLKLVELLTTKSAIDLARPAPDKAIAAAREALDLATAPECGYAWGEADAAHAWGLAFEARGEREYAQRAFRQALSVRERIEHPMVGATRTALQRVS